MIDWGRWSTLWVSFWRMIMLPLQKYRPHCQLTNEIIWIMSSVSPSIAAQELLVSQWPRKRLHVLIFWRKPLTRERRQMTLGDLLRKGVARRITWPAVLNDMSIVPSLNNTTVSLVGISTSGRTTTVSLGVHQTSILGRRRRITSRPRYYTQLKKVWRMRTFDIGKGKRKAHYDPMILSHTFEDTGQDPLLLARFHQKGGRGIGLRIWTSTTMPGGLMYLFTWGLGGLPLLSPPSSMRYLGRNCRGLSSMDSPSIPYVVWIVRKFSLPVVFLRN